MEGGKRLDLGANLGGDVQEDPLVAVGADGHAFLRARGGGDAALADAATVGAAAVLRRKPAAGGGADYPDAHASGLQTQCSPPVARGADSEGCVHVGRTVLDAR